MAKVGRKPLSDPVVGVGLKLDADIWRRVESLASELGVTQKRIVERALKEYLDSSAVESLERIKDVVNEFFEK